jgi:hypothetical protein
VNQSNQSVVALHSLRLYSTLVPCFNISFQVHHHHHHHHHHHRHDDGRRRRRREFLSEFNCLLRLF